MLKKKSTVRTCSWLWSNKVIFFSRASSLFEINSYDLAEQFFLSLKESGFGAGAVSVVEHDTRNSRHKDAIIVLIKTPFLL